MTPPNPTTPARKEGGELLALAGRCEAATGPDREIDISILRHVDPERLEWMNGQYAKGVSELIGLGPEAWEARKDALYSSCYTPPRYTASLDAAMTLIDPADEWSLTTMYNIARAEVGINRDQQTAWTGYGENAACIPVLALTAAALRARALSPARLQEEDK